jgi:hypothetical protein
VTESKKPGRKPGPPKLKNCLSLSPRARAYLDREAVKKGDKTGMAYLARNVERLAAEDEKKFGNTNST